MKPGIGTELLYLTREDVRDIAPDQLEIVGLVRQALEAHGRNNCEMPAKIGIHPMPNSLMHAMPAWVETNDACGIKWAENFPDNSDLGLPATSGLLVLNSPTSGWPVCVMDAVWITAKRTPAVTALACEYLAPSRVKKAGIAGAGVQGREHAKILPEVLGDLEVIHFYDPNTLAIESAVAELQPGLDGIELRSASSPEEMVRGSQIVVSATPILFEPNPQVRHEWVEPGSLLLPIDLDSYWEWETLSGADKFLVDSLEEMEHFTGVAGYFPNGLPEVYGELGEVVAGLKPGREREDELIVDMNIGMAVEDIVVGAELYRRACDADVGRILPL